MENIHQKRRRSIAELLKRFQDLEDAHARLKQKMFKFMISSDRRTSNLRSSHRCTPPSALNLTEADYFNILQSIDQPIHITDSKGCIIYRNHAWVNLYGYTAAEIRGKCSPALVVERTDIPIANVIIQRLFKGESWAGEFPVRNKSGERLLVFGSSKPFRDENGTIIGIITVSAAPRKYQQIRLCAPTKVNETRPTIDGIISQKLRGCFDLKTGRFCWHWLHSDQERECGLRMRAKVENRPWVVNSNCAGHINKALGPWSLCNDSVDCDIKWEDLIIKKRIGRGSCGTVYHAVWQGSDVALKLFSEHKNSHDLIVSFMHEVSLMKRIRHPNILLFMGSVTSPQRICIVTELLRRGNLFEIIHRNKARLDWRLRIHMAIDIARGISYLHHCLPPIIYRDLKSTNLLVDKNWRVKLGDLSMCRIKHATYATTMEEGIETPEWTAPEVLRNEQADERSDVYSYGVVLWEITTEKIPWDGLNSMQVMEAVGFMNQELDIPKDVDQRWASLIERCLCSEPQLRPTFEEILDELKDIHINFKFLQPLHEESREERNCKCETDA